METAGTFLAGEKNGYEDGAGDGWVRAGGDKKLGGRLSGGGCCGGLRVLGPGRPDAAIVRASVDTAPGQPAQPSILAPGARSDMRRSVTDGCAWAVMMGFGDQFLPAFVLALHLGERWAGLIATLPGFLGALLTLLTPWGVEKFGSHKRWTVLAAWLQALMFVPLVVAALVGSMPVWAAFAVVGLYQFGGLSAGVGWSTWIATIVPGDRRPAFFSFRNRMIWIFQLIAIFTAGWVLEQFPGERALMGFALVLSVACVARGVSAVLLGRISEPVPLPHGHRTVGFVEVASRLGHGPEARLIVYLFLVAFATNISLGFLPPFVLGALGEPKQNWALVMGAMMVGRIAILFPLGGIIGRFGARGVMMAAGVGIALVHGLFLLTSQASEVLSHVPGVVGAHPRLVYVMGVQVIAGVLYAAFDLTSWLLLLRHTRESERTSMITLTWSCFWVFSFLGTLAGSGVISGFRVAGSEPTQFTYQGYMWVFAVGTGVRVLTLLPLLTWVRRLPRD